MLTFCFAMTYYPARIKKIAAHVRRPLWSCLVDQQESRKVDPGRNVAMVATAQSSDG
jgi:hypothetical protein